MPDLATTDSAIKVVRWLIEVGQPVRRGQPLLEVETDKSSMEVEAVATGTLRSVHVKPEDEVNAGQAIATIEIEEAVAAPAGSSPTRQAAATPTPAVVEKTGGMFAKNRQAAQQPAAGAPFIPLSPAQRTAARRMQESKQTVPHFYLSTSANAEGLLARRAAAAKPIAWDAFFVHAVSKALQKYERMGLRFENDRLVPAASDAVGVAVDHNGELYVIALASPSTKTPAQLSDELRATVDKLRAGDPDARRLRPAAITVTNLGAANVETFTAIVNPPEAAILAIGKVAAAAVVQDGRVVPQQRVSLTLSVDHRVVNGKYAADFLGAVVQELETP